MKLVLFFDTVPTSADMPPEYSINLDVCLQTMIINVVADGTVTFNELFEVAKKAFEERKLHPNRWIEGRFSPPSRSSLSDWLNTRVMTSWIIDHVTDFRQRQTNAFNVPAYGSTGKGGEEKEGPACLYRICVKSQRERRDLLLADIISKADCISKIEHPRSLRGIYRGVLDRVIVNLLLVKKGVQKDAAATALELTVEHVRRSKYGSTDRYAYTETLKKYVKAMYGYDQRIRLERLSLIQLDSILSDLTRDVLSSLMCAS
jgi:hypothetical protein